MAKRKPCGKKMGVDWPGIGTTCTYERAPGLQQCHWHWLLKCPADVQAEWAQKRRAGAGELSPERARVPKEEWPAGERWCSGCQSFVPLFYVQGSRCRSCNSEAAHAGMVEKTYGISAEEYAALFALQGARCYICRRAPRKRRLAVDHDHATGEVRGLLCADNDRGCNHAILGNIKDLAMAKRIVEYLEDPPYSRILRERVEREAAASNAKDDAFDGAMMRPYSDPNKPGRKDRYGQEWWACDPYPTWFYWKHGELFEPPGGEPDWPRTAQEFPGQPEGHEPPF